MTGTDPGSRVRARLPDSVAIPVAAVLVLAAAVVSLSIGSPTVSPLRLPELLWGSDDSATAIIVSTIRLPRVLLAVAAGAALAVAGVVMQALTRNPLADPGILGINAGASFAVAFGIVVLGVADFGTTMWLAFLGAAGASVAVALLGTVGERSIARLALAGVAIGAVLAGLTAALSLISPMDYTVIRLWEAGSLAGRDVGAAGLTLAVVAVGSVLALAIGPGLNILVLGTHTARSLGARVGRVQAVGLVSIVLLAGAATAAVGPIAFVGLMVPHAIRAALGTDQIRALCYSLIIGPALLLAADILARVVIAPRELPLGVVTAFLGAPLLIALVLRRARSA